jgi:hypothetical protein
MQQKGLPDVKKKKKKKKKKRERERKKISAVAEIFFSSS